VNQPMTGRSDGDGEGGVPVRERGHYFEEFEPGQTFQHMNGRTLNAGDNSLFCTATLNFLPLYLDDDYAREHGHPCAPLHPLLLFGTVFGLSVEDLSEGGKGGPFLGVSGLVFHRPAYAGATVRAASAVIDKRPSGSRPEFGIVTWRTVGNHGGEKLLEFMRTNLVRRRDVD
jgi:itaconyl-CoA hydratase